MRQAKLFVVLPTILLLVPIFIVVCANPPPPETPTAVSSQPPVPMLPPVVAVNPTPTPSPAAPTPIPVPTSTATATPEPVGLGVSRRDFWGTYEDAGIICHGGSDVAGYSYKNGGYETWICDGGADARVKIELAGLLWDDDVLFARLTIYDPGYHADSAMHALFFLENAVPEWRDDAFLWVSDHTEDASDGKPVSVTHGDAMLTMQWVQGTQVEFILTVEAR